MKLSYHLTLVFAAFAVVLSMTSCNNTSNGFYKTAISSADTHTNSTFRAIIATDDGSVWAAGSGNTVVRTTDGGESWDVFTVGDSLKTEFRSLMAWNASTALVFTIDSPAVCYRTDDGGKSWNQVYYKAAKGMFIDSVNFSDELHGVAVGDPIDGKIFTLTTNDGGLSWTEIEGPENPGGMFAASNTCTDMLTPSRILIATSSSQVHIGDGNKWQTVETPITRGAANGCDGCYGIWMINENNGFLYGGNYEFVSNKNGVLAKTNDGGQTWSLCEDGIHGFVSAVAMLCPQTNVKRQQINAVLVASGSDGISVSHDAGSTWEDLSSELPEGVKGYHALTSTGDVIWAAGSHGHIGKIYQIVPSKEIRH